MRISDWSSDVCSSDLVEKSPTALMLYLATVRAGLVYLPLNTAYRSAEVEYFLTDAEPSVVVCDSKNLEWIEALAKKTNIANVYTLDADGGGSLAVDRKSVVSGKSGSVRVDLGGSGIFKKKKNT